MTTLHTYDKFIEGVETPDFTLRIRYSYYPATPAYFHALKGEGHPGDPAEAEIYDVELISELGNRMLDFSDPLFKEYITEDLITEILENHEEESPFDDEARNGGYS